MCNKVLNTHVECLYAISDQILKCLFSLVVHIYVFIYLYNSSGFSSFQLVVGDFRWFQVTPYCNNLGPHSVTTVRIRSFTGSYFPAFGLDTERYGISFRIQSECRKIQTKETPNMNFFHVVREIHTGKYFSGKIIMKPLNRFS